MDAFFNRYNNPSFPSFDSHLPYAHPYFRWQEWEQGKRGAPQGARTCQIHSRATVGLRIRGTGSYWSVGGGGVGCYLWVELGMEVEFV
jgi:hypothetical protein